MEEMKQNKSLEQIFEYDSSSDDESTKTFQNRLEDMPAYNMTVSNLHTMYTSLKETNVYLGSFLNIGERVAGATISVAKPVVMAATGVALKVAKPVIGEVKDPAASIDGCASEVLAKVQEKLPFVKQHPAEVVQAVKQSSAVSTAKDTVSYYYEKMKGLALTQSAVQQLDNAVAFSDLAVELILPSDFSNVDDLRELERAEEDENKGVLVHAHNVKAKACRRGHRKLMSYKYIRTSLDMVEYAQTNIAERTSKLIITGSNYSVTLGVGVNQCKSLGVEGWDMVYNSSMFIPTKALEVTGEVYVNAKDMIFKYSNAQTIKEMPKAISEMAESYYTSMNRDGAVKDAREKAVAIVTVPAQVLSSYLQSTRFVQWVLPQQLQTYTIQLMQQSCNDDNIKN